MELNGGVETCGICGRPGRTRRLHRDHDHKTGLPRGLLCFRCNRALPDYVTREWLVAALHYLDVASEHGQAIFEKYDPNRAVESDDVASG